jgi:citrate lyase subunit beta / citryl-CoA lyase
MSVPHPISSARTFLFVPGNRPDRFEKALAAGADMVVFDLEDAVPSEDKLRARALVSDAVGAAGDRVVVRVNAPDSVWHEDDVRAVLDAQAHVMLPKTESAEDIAQLRSPEGSSVEVIALIETPRGVLNAAEIARTRPVARLAFGGLDLAAAIGVDPDHREASAVARSLLVLASASAGLPAPIDGVTPAVNDAAILASDLAYAKGLGFTAKLCIHPLQLSATDAAFRPTRDELEWAERVLSSQSESTHSHAGVVVVDGRMVDAPVVKRAQMIIAAGNGRTSLETGFVE